MYFQCQSHFKLVSHFPLQLNLKLSFKIIGGKLLSIPMLKGTLKLDLKINLTPDLKVPLHFEFQVS